MPKQLQKIVDYYFSRWTLPYWFILFIDCAGVFISGFISSYIEFGGSLISAHFWRLFWGMFLTVLVFVVCFRFFHTYSGVLRYSSFADLKNVVRATFSASCITLLLSWGLNLADVTAPYLPDITGVFFIFLISTMFMWFMRVVIKLTFDTVRMTGNASKAFIYGAGAGAVAIAKSIQNQDPVQYSLVGFVNPGAMLESKYLMGVKVRKDGPGLIAHMKEAGAGVILVSPLQTEHFREREELINELIAAGIKILVLSNPEEWDGHSDVFRPKLRNVRIEDLLQRDKIEINMDGIASLLQGRRVMITGAAGSIGSEIVRQVASFHPSDMILVDQAETPMHDIRRMMVREFGAGCADAGRRVRCETIVANIADRDFMDKVMSSHRPEYIFHAAAYKHVPMMEDNPVMAVRNNIHGTRVLADLAVGYGVLKFVMISTDKAVNPTNVMGCSKRICEIYCQSLNKAIQNGEVQGVTQFVTTRFGNVLGSSGSVIPIFTEQIEHGGPVTVTDPDIIRYFMLIPEACKLVLEAGTLGHGGEIFVFDMGKPVRIVDLARRMIALSGAQNIEIHYTGLRDGEKLYEELLSDKENTKPTVHPKIMVASVREYDYRMACLNEDRLLDASYNSDARGIVKLMEEIVPEYRSTNERYK